MALVDSLGATYGERDLVMGKLLHDGTLPNDPLTFGPFLGGEGPLVGWIITKNGLLIDAGELTRPRTPKRGDRVIFTRGSIKSAAVGDVLGITCVFMPSGFAVGVPPPATNAPATGGGPFAYAEMTQLPWIFWLRKRRWDQMPRILGEYGTWKSRLVKPEGVGARESYRSRQQEQLIAAGVL